MFNEMMRAEIWLQDTLDTQRTIDDLAERLGYSASQTRRRFRQCFGMSPSTYRDRLRLEKAARLLTHTPRGVREISQLCGYRNHSAFSRAFQRHYLLSPREYRQTRQQELKRHAATLPRLNGVELRRLPTRTGLVTRRYEPFSALPPERGLGSHHAHLENATSRLGKDIPSVALFHGDEHRRDMPRIDIGLLLPPRQAAGLAVPPASRLVDLPATRCACAPLDTLERLPEVRSKLLAETLIDADVHYSGDPLRLVQYTERLELQVPLLSTHGAE